MEVYTIGSGEIVFEVLKAVSLCLNGGSGLLQAMFTIGGFSGVFIVYYIILYGNIQEVIKGLEDLIDDRLSFVASDDYKDEDNIFLKDVRVLREAIEIIKREV